MSVYKRVVFCAVRWRHTCRVLQRVGGGVVVRGQYGRQREHSHAFPVHMARWLAACAVYTREISVLYVHAGPTHLCVIRSCYIYCIYYTPIPPLALNRPLVVLLFQLPCVHAGSLSTRPCIPFKGSACLGSGQIDKTCTTVVMAIARVRALVVGDSLRCWRTVCGRMPGSTVARSVSKAMASPISSL
jgi:hypothetical protein